MRFIVQSLSVLFILTVSCHCHELDSFEKSACDDWQPYRQEKCIKIFQDSGLKTFDEAVSLCKEKNSNLLSIGSEDENKFLTKLVLNDKIANNFWMGLRYDKTSRSFKWIDKTHWRYTNWDLRYPKNEGGECVQVDVEESIGKWKNRACWKANLVVCQRMQTWSLKKVQQNVMELMRKLKENEEMLIQTVLKLHHSEEKLKENDKVIIDLIKKLNQQELETNFKVNETFKGLKDEIDAINKTSNEIEKKINSEVNRVENEQKQRNELIVKDIENVKKEVNKMPVGFIYLQLPHQPSPTVLWPDLKWSDVSSSLAGVFFRVLGGNSSEFGQVQDDFSPRIVRTETKRHDGNKGYSKWSRTNHFTSAGADTTRWTGYQRIHNCGNTCGGYYNMRFKISDGEVRPKNVAIRVWKRVE